MERRIAYQNTSQLEEIHLEIALLSFTEEIQLITEQLFGGKKILKEWDKQFIREGVMQNAMYDANMVHARTVRPHKPRKNFKILAYSSMAYTRSLNNDN
jgi:hypothetical protein